MVALPKGRRVGATVDAAREQVAEERAKAREAAKHRHHAAKMRKPADELYRHAVTASHYYAAGELRPGLRHKAFYKAYFAHRTAEAVKGPGVSGGDSPPPALYVLRLTGGWTLARSRLAGDGAWWEK